ncbi:HAMP domain-containing sensor histidine kinase [Deinococcus sonorensis]|uniref:histidine kinase n=2 Tax=Deinococcus sonorensis TaxID=309891 RepID=A0AAU7UCG5_9DEIO
MTLRTRLTLLYTALLSLLLLLLAVLVLAVMRNSLLGGVDEDLKSRYSQFTNLSEQLRLGPFASSDLQTPSTSSSGSLADPFSTSTSSYIRRTFPNFRVQIETLIGVDVAQLKDQAHGSAAQRRQLLDNLRRMTTAVRQSSGLDQYAPIVLTDDQLLRVISASDHRLLLTLNIPGYGQSSIPTRVLVQLAPYRYGRNTDNSLREVTALIYFGRSLTDTYKTLSILQTIMLVLFLFGAGTAAASAYLLAGQALSPLRMVQRAAEQIGGRTLAQRVPEPQTGDEVQSLAHALNLMLDRLEASFEAQRRFTSDASHELRTPVTAIQGHASYLMRRTQPTEQQQESLGIIKNESERLTGLIGSLLELARSDSGVLQLRRQPVLALLLLQDTARELRPLAQGQGATLNATGDEVAFEGDPDRMKQVVINLVSNALKVGSRHITLSSRAEPRGTPAVSGVRLTVQDDGPGIAPEHLGRLFDRFYRVEESRSRDQGGAGLGLSIVKSIVDAHQGQIWIESEPGQGAQVHVWLPLGNIPDMDDEDVA